MFDISRDNVFLVCEQQTGFRDAMHSRPQNNMGHIAVCTV